MFDWTLFRIVRDNTEYGTVCVIVIRPTFAFATHGFATSWQILGSTADLLSLMVRDVAYALECWLSLTFVFTSVNLDSLYIALQTYTRSFHPFTHSMSFELCHSSNIRICSCRPDWQAINMASQQQIPTIVINTLIIIWHWNLVKTVVHRRTWRMNETNGKATAHLWPAAATDSSAP